MTLVLNNFIGSLFSLEVLHDCLPRLKSLAITWKEFTNSGFHYNIKPAASTAACSFTFIIITPGTEQTTRNVLKYTRIKYPHLSTLEYKHDRIEGNDELNELGWLPLFNKLGEKLKKIFLNTAVLCDDLVKVWDQGRYQINHLDISRHSDTALKKVVQSQQIRHIQMLDFELSKKNIF